MRLIRCKHRQCTHLELWAGPGRWGVRLIIGGWKAARKADRWRRRHVVFVQHHAAEASSCSKTWNLVMVPSKSFHITLDVLLMARKGLGLLSLMFEPKERLCCT